MDCFRWNSVETLRLPTGIGVFLGVLLGARTAACGHRLSVVLVYSPTKLGDFVRANVDKYSSTMGKCWQIFYTWSIWVLKICQSCDVKHSKVLRKNQRVSWNSTKNRVQKQQATKHSSWPHSRPCTWMLHETIVIKGLFWSQGHPPLIQFDPVDDSSFFVKKMGGVPLGFDHPDRTGTAHLQPLHLHLGKCCHLGDEPMIASRFISRGSSYPMDPHGTSCVHHVYIIRNEALVWSLGFSGLWLTGVDCFTSEEIWESLNNRQTNDRSFFMFQRPLFGGANCLDHLRELSPTGTYYMTLVFKDRRIKKDRKI